MATKTTNKAARKQGEQDMLAAIAAAAQGKAKPAARISGANIKRVREKIGDRKPSDVLGISAAVLAQLATGKKQKSALKDEQWIALRDLGSALGSSTYYGKKLAGMLWAIETGATR